MMDKDREAGSEDTMEDACVRPPATSESVDEADHVTLPEGVDDGSEESARVIVPEQGDTQT